MLFWANCAAAICSLNLRATGGDAWNFSNLGTICGVADNAAELATVDGSGGGAAGRDPSAAGDILADCGNLGIMCGEFWAELTADDGFWGSGGGALCNGGVWCALPGGIGGGGSSVMDMRLKLGRLGGISGGILCGSWAEWRAGTSGGAPLAVE